MGGDTCSIEADMIKMKTRKIFTIIAGIVSGFVALLLLIGAMVNIGTQYVVSRQNTLFWIISWIVIVVLVTVVAFRFLKKKNITQIETKGPELVEIDFKELCIQALVEAKISFKEQKFKDAYSKASWAIRFYISNSNGIKKELTAYETINLLKKTNNAKDIKEAIDLCSMVDFAKYQPNEKDFNMIMNTAYKTIGLEQDEK